MNTRRDFLKKTGAGAAGLGLAATLPFDLFAEAPAKKLFFDISLAQFSLAGSFFSQKLTNIEFPALAKNTYGISNIEYVSTFWNGKGGDKEYVKELKARTDDLGVRNVLIMVDSEGELGHPDAATRKQAVENHYKWVEAAKELGCHAIRVNLDGPGTDEEIAKAGVGGYGSLVEFGQQAGINVIIENHFGPSTDAKWLVEVMKQVNNPYAGLLPDFGNFVRRERMEEMTIEAFKNAKVIATFDKYESVKAMMPYAKGVSAKTHGFDAKGNDTETDFVKMLTIIKDSGFKGYMGIEAEGAVMKMFGVEGNYPTEEDGIKLTKALLEKVGGKVS
ncbi:sugar phosphate isomerase/epimerase family protein [Imperialibacter roseus]|uniref:Sugar phosphate isomerase/epimerase family protein n=1 Tax=Imperialibacter roseus TaxID=1324217 RepID=A0ABZ0IUZ5_9BACT|nr:sugar phosphate isomerase/epimerase family protein [Imperialibacter roseus]WOK08867.1 sugar phosphate isomerase/epimerase family protein [Imperialibacter roseus]